MRVKSATHVLRHSVSTALQFLSKDKDKPQYESSAWIVGYFAKWFRIMSARNLTLALSKINKDKFVENINFLYKFIDFISLLKFGKGDWKPFQKGIVITTLSFIELSTFLIDSRNYQFILGGRLTKDCIENLFFA